jgi:type VI secretion system protein ImpE
MTAKEQFAAGRFSDALQAAQQEVRTAPGDLGKRWLLTELLCFNTDWERADKQLEVIASQDATSHVQMSVGLFRQLIRAAMSRQEVFQSGRVPLLLPEPTALLEQHLRALTAMREGDASAASELLGALEEASGNISGHCDQQPFSLFRDLDDITSSFFEVFTGGGDYGWLPFQQVSKAQFHAVERARDWLWRPAHIVLISGEPLDVFVPAIYTGSSLCDDEMLKLGRASDWREGQGCTRGLGHRTYLVENDAVLLNDLSEIQFEHHG